MIARMLVGFLSVAVLAATSVADEGQKQPVTYFANPSLISLIATPEKFSAKRIYISGYATVEHEGYRIFLSKEDARRQIYENSVEFDPSESTIPLDEMKKFHGKYVQIGGLVTLEPNLDGSGFSIAILREISMFRRL